MLQYNPLNDWDQHKWREITFKAFLLTYLNLSGSMKSLAQMPDIHSSLCNSTRTQPLALTLKSILDPCDCSLQWLADVTHQGCPVRLKTDLLQCGTQLQDLVLSCPATGMMAYTHDYFTGEFLLVKDNTSLKTFQPIKSVAVFGEQAWIIQLPSPSGSKILLPGRYATPQEAGMFVCIHIWVHICIQQEFNCELKKHSESADHVRLTLFRRSHGVPKWNSFTSFIKF